jgi:hypothetical protein
MEENLAKKVDEKKEALTVAPKHAYKCRRLMVYIFEFFY